MKITVNNNVATPKAIQSPKSEGKKKKAPLKKYIYLIAKSHTKMQFLMKTRIPGKKPICGSLEPLSHYLMGLKQSIGAGPDF